MKELKKNPTVQEVLAEIEASLPAIRKIKQEDGSYLEKPSVNSKFNEKQFRKLIFAILSDENYIESERFESIAKKLTKNPKKKLEKALHKLLKDAGVKGEDERQAIIDNHEFDEAALVDFIIETYEEGAHLYMKSGKTHRMFADKTMTLSLMHVDRKNTSGTLPEGKKKGIKRKVKYNLPKLPKVK